MSIIISIGSFGVALNAYKQAASKNLCIVAFGVMMCSSSFLLRTKLNIYEYTFLAGLIFHNFFLYTPSRTITLQNIFILQNCKMIQVFFLVRRGKWGNIYYKLCARNVRLCGKKKPSSSQEFILSRPRTFSRI